MNTIPTETAWSGIESLVTYMVKGFVELGVDVTLVSVEGSLWKDWEKVNLIEIPIPINSVDPEKLFYEGYKDRIKDYSCVIDNSNGKLARLANRRVIQVAHWLQHPISMGFKNVVCISKAHARWTKAQYPSRDRGPVVVYNGIDPTLFPFWDNKGDEFLFFSVLGPYKGADTVLKLAINYPEFKFGFGGRNTDYTRIIQEAATKHENITCYGEVNHEEKKRIMGHARALLQLPRRFNPYEQYPFMDIFPMTIIEANLVGTPVIGLAEGGVPEMIQDGVNGYIANDLSQVRYFMDHVQKISPLDCRKYAEGRFNHVRMAQDYLNLVDRVKRGDWW